MCMTKLTTANPKASASQSAGIYREHQEQREQENENPVCEIQFKIGQNMCGLKIICESIFWLINDIKVYLT